MIYKKNIFLLLFISSIALLLFGCATHPQTFGISDTEWKSYDKTKQQEILSNYKQLNKEFKQQDKFSQAMMDSSSHVTSLDVNVFNGTVIFPPFTDRKAYMPSGFAVMENSCANIDIYQQDGAGKIKLRACYKDRKLLLDSSLYDQEKKEGTVVIPFSPIWDQGFVYHGINSYGYVKLKNADVMVKLN